MRLPGRSGHLDRDHQRTATTVRCLHKKLAQTEAGDERAGRDTRRRKAGQSSPPGAEEIRLRRAPTEPDRRSNVVLLRGTQREGDANIIDLEGLWGSQSSSQHLAPASASVLPIIPQHVSCIHPHSFQTRSSGGDGISLVVFSTEVMWCNKSRRQIQWNTMWKPSAEM